MLNLDTFKEFYEQHQLLQKVVKRAEDVGQAALPHQTSHCDKTLPFVSSDCPHITASLSFIYTTTTGDEL